VQDPRAPGSNAEPKSEFRPRLVQDIPHLTMVSPALFVVGGGEERRGVTHGRARGGDATARWELGLLCRHFFDRCGKFLLYVRPLIGRFVAHPDTAPRSHNTAGGNARTDLKRRNRAAAGIWRVMRPY
jgi:hypothetical protein